MRLIDADAFLKRNEEYADCEFIHPKYQNTLREIVDDEPTIPTPRWHRVEEPPKQYGAFAVACVYDGKFYWCKGIYLDGKWLREGNGIEIPADYWMPIEPPKEDE